MPNDSVLFVAVLPLTLKEHFCCPEIFEEILYLSWNQTEYIVGFFFTEKEKGFVTATKLRTTNKIFVAATKKFAAATKLFVAVTKYFCRPYFNKDFFGISKPFFPC